VENGENQKSLTEKHNVDVEYYVQTAKRLVGDKVNDVDTEYIVRQCYELTRPRSKEEIVQAELELDKSFKEYMARQKQRRREEFYRKFQQQQLLPRRKTLKFFGIGFWWWS
jgi:hypothetical protein